MTLIGKIIREPLAQFLILGAVVFGAYSALDTSPPSADVQVIEVGQGQLDQMFQTFSRTWQRPPTEAEFKGLVDGYVKEEVFYREGKKMGLDENDTIFRRRMQQKLEFLLEPDSEELTPKAGELEAYFKLHAETYKAAAMLEFEQLFFRSDASGDAGELAAAQALEKLKADPKAAETTLISDPTILPPTMALSGADMIASNFGDAFAKAVMQAPMDQWSGPVRSTFGVHLVRPAKRVAASTPALDAVRAAVQGDWEASRRREIADRRYEEMKKNYEVRVNLPSNMPATPIKTAGVK
ncbi:peptidyl-prolyl cis-trans isomerase [Rhizobium sp. TH2]|uniref:peptidylprolyl isomerase n=1 Tax=Rhizobium sp. TH2 TaxID=2775403 RepID=UPI0021581457|nr:peptidylprolyl isomerase [Rhizobium sp. TH2]UVC08876.1 peptidyl-prolyl cis-trans isomerase [Rhizobium sp. TH2]